MRDGGLCDEMFTKASLAKLFQFGGT